MYINRPMTVLAVSESQHDRIILVVFKEVGMHIVFRILKEVIAVQGQGPQHKQRRVERGGGGAQVGTRKEERNGECGFRV